MLICYLCSFTVFSSPFFLNFWLVITATKEILPPTSSAVHHLCCFVSPGTGLITPWCIMLSLLALAHTYFSIFISFPCNGAVIFGVLRTFSHPELTATSSFPLKSSTFSWHFLHSIVLVFTHRYISFIILYTFAFRWSHLLHTCYLTIVFTFAARGICFRKGSSSCNKPDGFRIDCAAVRYQAVQVESLLLVYSSLMFYLTWSFKFHNLFF